MKQLEEYANQARTCREAAADAHTDKIREHLLEIAEHWEELARQRAIHLNLEHVLEGLLKGIDYKDGGTGGAA